ncbi:hypothetical protein GCM10022256_23650 [Frondihabitans peucedani]|uniref:Uncharacterized protein n=1 Tax=Frondihabitans peucedani TaxID=598626 RepID=A0ABP8E3F0_9MICO
MSAVVAGLAEGVDVAEGVDLSEGLDLSEGVEEGRKRILSKGSTGVQAPRRRQGDVESGHARCGLAAGAPDRARAIRKRRIRSRDGRVMGRWLIGGALSRPLPAGPGGRAAGEAASMAAVSGQARPNSWQNDLFGQYRVCNTE